MEIREIRSNRREYLGLLLMADEQEDMIDRYLERGEMYGLFDPGIRAVCVVTDEGGGVLELKNLAVEPESRGKGYGREMIHFLCRRYGKDFRLLQAGTGDSPLTVSFYEACGFVRSHVVKDFFTKHYREPIIEAGVLLRDMVYFRMEFHGEDQE